MLARHLVVFAKTPRLGVVKTRLAADVGNINAWRFYRLTLNKLLVGAGRRTQWRPWLALPPIRGSIAAPRLPLPVPPWQLLSQGPGDLGERMSRIMRSLPPGPAIIIGSDIPGISNGHLTEAFNALRSHHVVIGPAPDGGFWLVGSRRIPRVPELFSSVRWSTPHARADTRANAANLSIFELPLLEDIDDGDAYDRWRRQSRHRYSISEQV